MNKLLTITEKKSTVFSGPEVSLSELQALVVSVLNCSAAPDAIATYEQLRVGAADAYFASAGFRKCDRSSFLDLFFTGTSVADAAQACGVARMTGYRWLEDFCAFATHWLAWDAECKRDDEARDLQCEESCGRKYFDDVTGGGKRTSGARTAKRDRPNWRRCMDCPRARADVDMAR